MPRLGLTTLRRQKGCHFWKHSVFAEVPAYFSGSAISLRERSRVAGYKSTAVLVDVSATAENVEQLQNVEVDGFSAFRRRFSVLRNKRNVS